MVVELAVLRQSFAKHYGGGGGVGEGEGCARGRVKLPCASPLYIGVEGAGLLPSKSIGALAKVGGKYIEIKASLHLFQESILFLGKDENQALARSLSEKGNSFNLTTSLSTFFCFAYHINQRSYLDE